MIIVSNTTSLIGLATIERFDLLHHLFGKLYIPQAVYDEAVTVVVSNFIVSALDHQRPVTKGHFISRLELFFAPRFDDPIQQHLTPLNNHFGLPTRTHQAMKLQKLI